MSSATEPLMNPSGALSAALRSKRWVAGPAGNGVRLAGAFVDASAQLVTHVGVFPATASINTRLPVLLPDERRRAAASMCALLSSRTHRAVSIDVDGAPSVTTRPLLIGDERAAAAKIVVTVLDNRRLAAALTPVFVALRLGATPEDALAEGSLEEHIPSQAGGAAGTRLQLPVGLEAPDAMMRASAAIGLSGPEAEGFARYLAHVENQPDTQPLCVGPLLLHADGALECYGCSVPANRRHAAGASTSCVSGRAFGAGHRCQRCG